MEKALYKKEAESQNMFAISMAPFIAPNATIQLWKIWAVYAQLSYAEVAAWATFGLHEQLCFDFDVFFCTNNAI